MLFLDSLYRDAAGKAGITYVDVWDGFVDEAGRFLQQGPDFEGQIRRLRAYDGVFFTKPGARKLAHYVEREITRLMAVALGADRTADRARNARCQRQARPAGAASAGGADPAAGGVLGRHRPVARRSRLASRLGRRAGGAHAGEGRTARAACRPRRRFCLAAPRSRPRAGHAARRRWPRPRPGSAVGPRWRHAGSRRRRHRRSRGQPRPNNVAQQPPVASATGRVLPQQPQQPPCSCRSRPAASARSAVGAGPSPR